MENTGSTQLSLYFQGKDVPVRGQKDKDMAPPVYFHTLLTFNIFTSIKK